MNTLLYGDMAETALPSKYQNEKQYNTVVKFMGFGDGQSRVWILVHLGVMWLGLSPSPQSVSFFHSFLLLFFFRDILLFK